MQINGKILNADGHFKGEFFTRSLWMAAMKARETAVFGLSVYLVARGRIIRLYKNGQSQDLGALGCPVLETRNRT